MPSHTATAIVQRANGLVEETVTLPPLEEHQVLVKVIYAAFNPTDVQSFDANAFGDGAVLGCDFAGIVEEVGPGAKAQVGDRISTFVWGGEVKGIGAYATHCIADSRLSFKIPTSLTFAEASTLPLALTTAWLALFSKDCLNIPRSSTSNTSLLVWGGSSSVGAYTLQLAAKHNITTATVCSPRNFPAARRHGATHVFDYNDTAVTHQISEKVPGLAYAFDTIGNATSSALAAEAMGAPLGGKLCTVRPGKANTEGVREGTVVMDVFVWTAFPKAHEYKGGLHWPIHPEDHALSVELFEQLPGWLEDGTVRPQRQRVLRGLSVASVKEAMGLCREGRVSNEKVCIEVSQP